MKRAVIQSSIWIRNNVAIQNVPPPEGWAWTRDSEQGLVPLWMTISEAATACNELIKCGCKSEKGCTVCKCVKSGLSFNDLSTCKCEI